MNENELLTPDYLFEVSWEVCNKVGGIHTVVSTKARTVESKLGDNYLLIGPDIQREGDNPEFEEDDELLKAWRQSVYNDGIRIRIGRWRVVGRPIAVLVDYTSLFPKKDDILKFLWETYHVDSISGQWDYIEPVLFGHAAARHRGVGREDRGHVGRVLAQVESAGGGHPLVEVGHHLVRRGAEVLHVGGDDLSGRVAEEHRLDVVPLS